MNASNTERKKKDNFAGQMHLKEIWRDKKLIHIIDKAKMKYNKCKINISE